MIETKTLKRSSTNSDIKMEVNAISDYLKPNMPLPQYLPYARFLLDTDLSHTAKLLYTLLLDRATLSQKNNWMDAQGRIYVLYPLSSLAKDLRCSISSITRAFSELENAQLVERVRNGFSKPSRILLKVPHTTQNCTVTVCKNAEHDCAEMSSMTAQKCTPNQRNKNNLKDSHLIRTTDAHLTFGEWHILRSAATLTASATPTKMNTARAVTNGRAFPPKRRQRTERNKSNTSWQREPS